MIRVLTEEKELKASTVKGIQYQLLENRHYCITNDYWRRDHTRNGFSVITIPAQCREIPEQREPDFSKLLEARIKYSM